MRSLGVDGFGHRCRRPTLLSHAPLFVLGLVLTFLLPNHVLTAADTIPPTLRIVEPARDAEIAGGTLTVEIEYSDRETGIAARTLHVFLNGKDYAGQFDQHSRGASGQLRLPTSLPMGENKLTAEIADRAGNVARVETQVFYPGSGWLTIVATTTTQIHKVSTLALSGDGNTLSYGMEDGTIQVWRKSGSKLTQSMVLEGHRGSITALALTEDGRLLASGGEDRTVRLWNLAVAAPQEGRVIGRHGLRVTALSFSPDSRTLASGSGDRTVRLWSVSSDEQRELATLVGHTRVVSCLAFSTDGKRLVSGSADGVVLAWNSIARNLPDPLILSGHLLKVVSVAVSPDGKTVVSGSKDGTIRVWDISGRTSKQKALVEWFDQPIRVVTLPHGTALLTVHGDNRIALWDTESVIKHSEAELPSPIDSVAVRGSRVVTHHSDGLAYLFNIDDALRKIP